MTIAIKRANGDLIWFDAVTSFSRQLSGSVSKHPLETGAVVTDHTTVENEVISLSGVLSDFDFNLHRPTINSQDAFQLGLTNKQFVNNTPVTSVSGTEGVLFNNVIIDDRGGSILLPESVAQFFGNDAPSVTIDSRTPDKVKPALSIQDDLRHMFEAREEFALLSFYDQTLRETLTNCILVNLSFTEDADSGEAVYPEMTIERVRYATSTSVKIRTRVAPSVEKKAAAQQNQGKQAATGGVTSEDKGVDEPQGLSTQTTSQLQQQIDAGTTP